MTVFLVCGCFVVIFSRLFRPETKLQLQIKDVYESETDQSRSDQQLRNIFKASDLFRCTFYIPVGFMSRVRLKL